MATERRLVARIVGVAWLGVGAAFVVRLAMLCLRELVVLRDVGRTTLLERASQLKPWPWKTPWSALALVAYAVALAGGLAALWVMAVRAWRSDGKR